MKMLHHQRVQQTSTLLMTLSLGPTWALLDKDWMDAPQTDIWQLCGAIIMDKALLIKFLSMICKGHSSEKMTVILLTLSASEMKIIRVTGGTTQTQPHSHRIT